MKRILTLVTFLTLSQTLIAGKTISFNFISDTVLKEEFSSAYTPYLRAIKVRLDSIQKDVSLNHNEYVQAYIESYLNRKSDIGRLLGLAKYYFPIYEKAFREAGIPEEIKFLSIVESELNPYAVSRVGATGPWQFMYATAKSYGLTIDDYIDERRDPIRASYAAAAYIKNAYQEFGDWQLAIAAYNCGTSSVERAIDKAGGAMDFWSIRQFLPAETRGYVPKFIAASYVMSYFNNHNIVAQPCAFGINTDTVMVNRMVSINSLAAQLQVDAKELALLNPAYKRGVVHGTPVTPRRLVIPQLQADKFAVVYEALNGDAPTPAIPTAATYMAVNAADHRTREERPAYHTVKRGETLDDVADRYGVEVQDLRAWNGLKSARVLAGRKLRLNENMAAAKPVKEKAASKYLTYKVKRGDTLSALAEKFEATVDSIKQLNGLKKNALTPGMSLRISKV